jgi:mannose-1-phosphate guanylyltransferase
MLDMTDSGLSQIKAVILVGGLGTRLHPLTDHIPKSVVPVLNRPFMEHTFAYLKSHGIEDIILTVNYLPEKIREYFGDGSRFGVRLVYCYEAEPMGTAGAVKNACEYLDTTFLVMNGDVFTDLDLTDLIACHRRNGSKTTISLQWVKNPSAFGVVETDARKRVLDFIEKPPPGEETTNWINAGIYVIEPEILDYIPEKTHHMFERGLFPRIVREGEPVFGYEFHGYWMDTGTLLYYRSLNHDLLLGKTCSPLIGDMDRNGITLGENITLHSSAVITPPVLIGDRCRIESGVVINGPVVIGENTVLESSALVDDSVIWDNVMVGSESKICRSIISRNVWIEPRMNITDCAVTSDEKKSMK